MLLRTSLIVFLFSVLWSLTLPLSTAEAHLVYGRRPFDFFVGKADAMVVVSVKTPTQRETAYDGGPVDISKVLVESCLDGVCPKGQIYTVGSDDHAPSLERDGKYVLALQSVHLKLPSGNVVRWRMLQNSWETHPLTASYLDGVKTFTPRFRKALTLRHLERERLYLDTLVAQGGHPDPLLQADAIHSLLRFPPERSYAGAVTTLLSYLDRENLSESSRLGFLIVTSTWDPAAVRKYLGTANWALFENDNLARALTYLGYGNQTETAIPCRWLADPNPTVRAAAVSACIPKGEPWTTVVIAALGDSNSQVQKAAKNRLRKNVASRPAVRQWGLAQEPWWRRIYLMATGNDPAGVREIFTDSGVAKP